MADPGCRTRRLTATSLHHWRRPRTRVHPSKPKVGIRASKPNQVWHIDATVIRLLDGTRAYRHAVIENFSRKILAWTVSERLEPANTVSVLLDASRHVAPSEDTPTLIADGGVENFNSRVSDLARQSGYRAAWTSERGPVRSESDLFAMPRQGANQALGRGAFAFKLEEHRFGALLLGK